MENFSLIDVENLLVILRLHVDDLSRDDPDLDYLMDLTEKVRHWYRSFPYYDLPEYLKGDREGGRS